MTAVLLVEDDPAFRNSVERDLRLQGLEVVAAGDVDEALRALALASFDVVVTDLRMHGADGFDLLRRLRELGAASRAILMSGYASARDYQTAIELGAVRVLCKPFTSGELTQAIQQAVECSVGFRGSIHGLSLVDVLQMFHLSRRTVTILVAGAGAGRVCLKDGVLLHAEFRDTTGEAALGQLLRLPSGAIATESLREPVPHTITRHFEEVVLDALRELDEDNSKDDPFAAGSVDELNWDAWGDAPAPPPRPAAPARATSAPGRPLPRTTLPPVLGVEPDTAWRTALLERFNGAWRLVEATASPAIVVAARLSGGDALALRVGLDAPAWAPPLAGVVAAARRLCDDSRVGVMELIQPGLAAFLTWDVGLDAVVTLADTLRSPGELARLRAAASTFARAFAGELSAI